MVARAKKTLNIQYRSRKREITVTIQSLQTKCKILLDDERAESPRTAFFSTASLLLDLLILLARSVTPWHKLSIGARQTTGFEPAKEFGFVP
jgi:hypothetical protein